MDYKKLEKAFIEYCRTIEPIDRIRKRNPNDFRLSIKLQPYTEKHHIVPSSIGGATSKQNLVRVLPEEHIFFHKLRYKIYHYREDMLAIRCCLNGICSKQHLIDTKYALTKKILSGYAFIKEHSYRLRNTEGWHTEDGIRRISEARKGTMPARDINTGKLIGSVSTSHPKVLSGEWVHHSKNRIFSKEERHAHSIMSIGSSNGNYSGITDDQLVEIAIAASKALGYIPSSRRLLYYCKTNNIKFIKSYKSRFNKGGYKELINQVEEITGVKYSYNICHRRGFTLKEKKEISKLAKDKRFYKKLLKEIEETKCYKLQN